MALSRQLRRRISVSAQRVYLWADWERGRVILYRAHRGLGGSLTWPTAALGNRRAIVQKLGGLKHIGVKLLRWHNACIWKTAVVWSILAALPALASAQPIELVDGISSGQLGYSLVGEGSSTLMILRIENKTDTAWTIEIERGLKLEPSGSSAQTMVVTQEVQVKLEPHQHEELELHVDCLDISKPPPGRGDTTWSISKAPELAQFIHCTNGIVNDLKGRHPADAGALEKMRPNLLQMSVWGARGATRQEWVHFFVQWMHMQPDAAESQADQMAPVLESIVQLCGSLS
jgi:hypothetical protein